MKNDSIKSLEEILEMTKKREKKYIILMGIFIVVSIGILFYFCVFPEFLFTFIVMTVALLILYGKVIQLSLKRIKGVKKLIDIENEKS